MLDQKSSDYTSQWLPVSPQFITLGDKGPTVRYLQIGQGPALVLLHTVRTQLDLFQRVIPKLANDFSVYALDYPGFGWSEIVPDADYREPALRRHVLTFIEKMQLDDITLAGESIGATLALTAASELGSRVRQVVAFNTYDYLPGLERANLLASIIIKSVRAPVIGSIFASLENRDIVNGIVKGGFFDPRKLPSDFVDELARVGKRAGYSRAARAVYKALPSFVAARSRYSSITSPVTLVYGDHDWSRPSEREAVRSLIHQAKMITLPNAGHFTSLERADEFVQILSQTKFKEGRAG
ncbi:alpha/beta hydrolase [Methylocella silvestris]|uniref:Alpha/beta hydrolase n=2 Tax=Methylocella silvestris TaxID=199596 RepID=A0A2J7TJ48_METSI|nr:alpha/beta hydrolase [Methylocella silvestris]